MKKAFLGISAALCATAMCVSFAACGGGSNAKGVASIEVTEAQWQAAIDYLEDDDSTFAITVTSKQKMSAYGQTATMTTTIKARQKGGNAYLKTTVSSGGQSQSTERYTGIVDSTRYSYKLTDGTWTKEESSINIIDTGVIPFYGFEYEDFTYSAEDKGYTSGNSVMPQILKFGEVNGEIRLVALYSYVETSGGSNETSYTISYSGVSDITLPA